MTPSHPLSPRRNLTTRVLLSALGAVVVSLLFTTVSARAEPGDGISATGATVDKFGWWHEKNVATSTPVTNITVPPPPGVPEGTLAVGAINGEPDRIAAVGIVPEAVPGDTITRFTLAIKEEAPPALNANTEDASIVACPITEYWGVGGENGTWDTRPVFDCDLAAVPGTRAGDGTWSFDLAPIGAIWTDPAGTVAADGIVLVAAADPSANFQAVFATSGEGALVVNVESSPGAPAADPFEPDPSPPGGFDTLPADGGDFQLPDVGSGNVAVGGLPAPEVPTPTAPEEAAPLDTTPTSRSTPSILGALPGALAIGIPAFLALLTLMSLSVGPLGEPIMGGGRQRGVSRALAARSVQARHDTATAPEASR